MLVNRGKGRPKPANRGAVVSARSAVDVLSRAAQERTVNALSVQGYPCEYYAYKHMGTTCTCTQLPTTPVLPEIGPGVTMLDPEGNASPNHIRAMLQGSTISIDRYGSRTAHQGSPDDYLEERSVPNRRLVQDLEQHNKTTDAGDPFSEFLEPGDDLADMLDDAKDNAGSTFGSTSGQSNCGVCLGTGFVGGYNFVNGSRISYDTQHPWAVTGFVPDETVAPHTWKQVASPAYAQLFILVPQGMTRVRAFRLWNNRQLLTNYRAEISIDNQTFVPANARSIAQAADGRLHAVRIVSLTDNLVFTHLEVVLDLKLNPVYVEWSRLTQTENPRLPENTEPVQIVVSPTVPQVSIYDVVIDSTYDRVWKITSVTNFKDRQSRPQSWEASARLVQRFEMPQLLANSFLLHRHAEYSNALVPAVHNENWSGHEDTSTR